MEKENLTLEVDEPNFHRELGTGSLAPNRAALRENQGDTTVVKAFRNHYDSLKAQAEKALEGGDSRELKEVNQLISKLWDDVGNKYDLKITTEKQFEDFLRALEQRPQLIAEATSMPKEVKNDARFIKDKSNVFDKRKQETAKLREDILMKPRTIGLLGESPFKIPEPTNKGKIFISDNTKEFNKKWSTKLSSQDDSVVDFNDENADDVDDNNSDN